MAVVVQAVRHKFLEDRNDGGCLAQFAAVTIRWGPQIDSGTDSVQSTPHALGVGAEIRLHSGSIVLLGMVFWCSNVADLCRFSD